MSLVNITKMAPKSGPQYWRSLQELSGTSQFRDWVSQEFPGGSELFEGESRRNVLKLMAASFGLAGLSACRRPEDKILPLAKGVEDLVPGKPFLYNTAYTLGGQVMGLTVEAHDGRPTKIEGHAAHPQSLGAVGAFAQASVLGLYDPDRSQQVLRDGKPAKWSDWDAFAATQFTADKLGQGEGLRIVSEKVVSPALADRGAALAAKFPKSVWVSYDPINDDNAYEGSAVVFGKAHNVHYHYDKADVVVSLDADFLGGDSKTPLAIKQFSKKRRVSKESDSMNRLYVVESQFSLTGAMADHRVRTRSADVDAFAGALARELGVVADLSVLGGAADKAQKTLMAMVRDLKANGGKSIVVAGPRQPARVHALALMINVALGNVGQTVTLTASNWTSQTAALKALAADLSAGKVTTLVVLGNANPVFTAPADLDFAAAMKKVPVSVHLGLEVDETAVAAKWHLPEAHYLEAWGDAVSADGTASVQQPLIAPLYGGRSALELTAQLAGDKAPKGYEIVRAAWLKQFAGDKEAAWRKALHDGVIAAAAKPVEVKPAVDVKKVQLPAAAPKVAGVEVVFVPDASIYDGRFANNAWLQEAPDPMTKLVWDNAAMMSVATAKQLGVVDGDLIKLTSAGKTIEIAAMTQPGQADNSISIALGYGRTEVGRVGKGAGFNAYPLRSTAKLGFGEVTVAKGSGTYKLITTQEHHSMVEPLTGHKRPIVLEGTLEFWRREPHFAPETVEAPDESIYGVHDYSKGYQWGMSIDLATCIGCNACVVACVAENNIPVVGKVQVGNGREMHWIRMDRYYTGSEDDPQAVMQPLNCQQCEAAPCESVCPVAATVHSPEGLNDMAYNRCVGTRYCANNCPYKVRRFNFLNYHKTMTEVEKLASNPDVTVRMRGVMEKCTYCVQRIQEKRIQAKLEGRRPIRDGEVVTACQQACPAEAIVFGNVNDPESKVSLLKKQSRNYALLPDLNTRPRTTFLAKLRNPNPELSGETAGAPKEHHG